VTGGASRRVDANPPAAKRHVRQGVGEAWRNSQIGAAVRVFISLRPRFRLAINTQTAFAAHIENVINNPSQAGGLINGRSYFYDEASNTIVIRNPGAADGGTAFKIDTNKYPDPYTYIRRLR